MNGVNNLDIGVRLDKTANRTEKPCSMGSPDSHVDEPLKQSCGYPPPNQAEDARNLLFHRVAHSINSRVARDVNRFRTLPFRKQILFARSVGEKLYRARMPTACRLNSSGKGE